MNENNQYASLDAPVAAFAAASERAGFLKKVYGLLFLGVLGFAATLWAAGNVPLVNGWAMSMGRLIWGNSYGWLIYAGIFYGGSMLVHSLAEQRPIGTFAYAGWVVLLGLLVAPIVLFVSDKEGGLAIINQASALTAIVFGVLTVYVLYTGKDFSWMRGILFMACIALFVTAILGWFMGFSLGLWFSAAIVLLCAGYILYDTSLILNRLPTSMPMTGAILLFTDVVLLFKHLLYLLSSRD
ncbi:MAG: FtsH-binding integral membrane protein [Planctomycetota bacterium]|jgi:FtsH-binding integral membrane protein